MKITCPVCHKKKLKLLVNIEELQLYICQSCEIRFTSPKIKKSKDYYENFSLKNYIAYYKKFRIKYFKQNWKIIKSILPNGKGIDIGASFGWFIQSAPKSWDMIGLEPSSKVANYAKLKGLRIITGGDEKLKNKKSRYDLITLWNVFEHLSDPLNSLRMFKNTLKPKGLLVLAVPNKDGLINRLALFLTYLKIYGPINTLFQVESSSPHLFHYNEKNIKTLLKNTGFEFIMVRPQPIIDLDNIDKRMTLEGKNNFFSRQITKMSLLFLYTCSILFKMPDEIVIYARKV